MRVPAESVQNPGQHRCVDRSEFVDGRRPTSRRVTAQRSLPMMWSRSAIWASPSSVHSMPIRAVSGIAAMAAAMAFVPHRTAIV